MSACINLNHCNGYSMFKLAKYKDFVSFVKCKCIINLALSVSRQSNYVGTDLTLLIVSTGDCLAVEVFI